VRAFSVSKRGCFYLRARVESEGNLEWLLQSKTAVQALLAPLLQAATLQRVALAPSAAPRLVCVPPQCLFPPRVVTNAPPDVIGPATATRGIIHIYDVFGYFPQIQQGADRLAVALNAVVLMPDFLDGFYAKKEWFSALTAEASEEKQRLMAHISIGRHSESLLKCVEAAKQAYPSVISWGALGMCWGGKVVAVTSGKDTPFKVTGSAHPA
jgi:Dienelactone hydrolase family